jgi:hypothetical protein
MLRVQTRDIEGQKRTGTTSLVPFPSFPKQKQDKL